MPSSAEITNASVGSLAVNTNLRVTDYVDDSANPGNRTVNALRGRSAFAIGGDTVVITNNKVTATSQVIVSLETIDATLLYILTAAAGPGGFVVIGNTTATAATKFAWTIINP
jgi:hypothetical protein